VAATPLRASVSASLVLTLGLVALASGRMASSQPVPPLPEYQAKAAFLYNFARFVEWPPTAFDDDRSPVVLGVLGRDPFGPDLEETMLGKTVHGRPIVIRHFARSPETGRCHILFAGRGEAGRLRPGEGLLKQGGVLTVTEEGARGSMIRLVREDNRIRFEVDLQAVEAAGLKISSRLLRVGKLVGPGKD